MEKPSLSDAREMTPSRSIVQVYKVICGSGSPCKRNLIKRNLTSRKRCSLIGHPNSSVVEQLCSTCFPDPLRHYTHNAIMFTSVGSGYETTIIEDPGSP